MVQLRDSTIPAFGAYMLTDDGCSTAAEVARQGSWDTAHIHRGGILGAGRLTDDRPLADRLIAEIGNEGMDQACDSVTSVTKSGARLIVLGRADDLASYRAIRAAGAVDYFAFPVAANDVLSAFAPANGQNAAPAKSAHIIGVSGCTGGVGASALAQNLARLASKARGLGRVALVDADLAFAPLAHDLNQEPTAGIRDALLDPKRIDRLFLDASMTRVQDSFWLYSYGIRDGGEAQKLQAKLPDLLQNMAPHFDVILVDIAKESLVARPEIAAALDEMILVISPGYAGLNGYARLARACHEGNAALTPVPVLSNIRTDTRLSRKEIAAAIGRKPAVVLPNQERGMVRAQKLGQPFVDVTRRGPYAKQIGTLWGQIMPEAAKGTRTSWPSFLHGLRR